MLVVCCRSTDSELKLWNVHTGQCLRTFKGHVNEKNFVGLSVSNDFIACGIGMAGFFIDNSNVVLFVGSENNSLYVYSKEISTPMLTYKFNVPSNILVWRSESIIFDYCSSLLE